MSRLCRWIVLIAGAGFSCSVPFDDDLRYRCDSDRDCGGDGFVCVAETDGKRFCCKSSGAEVCGDGLDNDCNGLIDAEEDLLTETCNTIDDDCDGRIDEDFFFEFNDTNCGGCGIACFSPQTCQGGTCVPP